MPEAHATDARIVDLWVSLHESPHTCRAYRAEAERFLTFVGKGLREIGYGDMIAYRDGLGGSPGYYGRFGFVHARTLRYHGESTRYLQRV